MESNEALAKVIEDYERLRAENTRKRDLRVSEVYNAVPEIEEIEKEIANVGSSTLNEILNNPDKKGLKEAMHEKFEVLKKKKRELLIKNSIPLDYDKIKYNCNKCSDTGYIEGVGKCTCFKQKMLDYIYEQSRMSELIKNQNFENFDMSYYDKKPVKGFDKSPYDNMTSIKNYCEKYAADIDNMKKSLCFYGDTGLGKTFMSCCVAKELMKKGKTVLYISATKLFKMLNDEQFGRETDGLDRIYDCDLLVIDDLGTENESRFNNSYLFDVINERIINNKKMIINTNLNFKGLEDKYTKRFSSRLIENFTIMLFYGEDIRKKKMGK